MKIEFRTLIYSMMNNLVIAVIKIIGGFIFHLNSLLSDGIHTLSDFVTDIICLISAKIAKRKPTKYHPFGFGKVEYLANLFVGIILFALGIFVIVGSFGHEITVPNLSILWFLLMASILKILAIVVMNKVGNKINSQILITSVEESKVDLYSSFAVAIVIVLLQFSNQIPILKYADIVGSILMGILILKTAFTVISDNSLSLIGEVEDNPEVFDKVKVLLSDIKEIEDQEILLIKYGSYYKLQLTIELNSSLSLRRITNIENKIKKQIIRHRSLKIKYVTIYVTNKMK